MGEHSIGPPRVAASHVVAIAGSAGGLDALHAIFAALPADFAGAIVVVQHRMAAHGNILCELLRTWTSLDVRDACDGDELLAGTILIAPADRHMTVTAERTIVLLSGRPIHHVLSSADPLFETAAATYGARLTAVVLTGGDGDGSTGVRTVKRYGGTVIAQDPATAYCGDMPLSAIATGTVDFVLPLEAIAAALVELVSNPAAEGLERPVGSA
jgi:two-component system, chemotaxis family, protein-glutamate methylesterase/glutaminase